MAFIDHFEQELAHLPTRIKSVVEPSLRQYCQQFDSSTIPTPYHPKFLSSVVKVWACSPFVANQCLRHPSMLNDLLLSSDLFFANKEHCYRDQLAQYLFSTEAELMTVLRQCRRREMVRIAWRDLAGWAELEETLQELSWLAESCIRYSLDCLFKQACQEYGTPVLTDGSVQQLIVLAMGKLGAWELNFSSDIDLIFGYLEDGVLDDAKQTTYGEFFLRLARHLVKVLGQKTVDGFVFRVDTRLRPFGDSGPLVMNFYGMESYYHTQAREWERYAMIKARQVAGDAKAGAQLFEMLQPFIYRRYLDYGAFAELRSLKLQISATLKAKKSQDNIKLGVGGIREIEFIGQAFQLIRGGREPALQQRQILRVLATLASLQQLSKTEAKQLQDSYCFLRRVENRLQQFQDQQTHSLPTDVEQQQILAFAMDYPDWQSFKIVLDALRCQIQNAFEQVFSIPTTEPEQNAEQRIWHAEGDQQTVVVALQKIGFEDAKTAQQRLHDFKQSASIVRLHHKGAQALQKLMPALLRQLAQVDNPDLTLARILDLLEKIAGRSVYLALLAENSGALTQLIKLSSASNWICQYLAKHPVIYDQLLDVRSLYEPLNKADLTRQISQQLATIATSDVEQVMIVLREFKQVNVLKVASADIMGVMPLMQVSDYLSSIAEVILEQSLQWLWRLLVDKHGAPGGTRDLVTGFGVVGMGKLGGYELGYGSDLDMVFLYDCRDNNTMTEGEKPISHAQFYGRLGLRLMTMINTRMLPGVLYEVDMRLRPNGNSGLLVSKINAYRDYLNNQAWTWEHQALVRGRFIVGDSAIQQKFEKIRQQVLCLTRDQEHLKTEVREMRENMRNALAVNKTDQFHLKHSLGGIADIEFIVQFKVLAQAQKNPQLTTYTDSIRILTMLQDLMLIGKQDSQQLQQAYCAYRDCSHRLVLQGQQILVGDQDFVQMRSQVCQLWEKIMASNRK